MRQRVSIQEEPGRQQENRRLRVASTVAHESTLIAFHLLETSLVVRIFPSVLVEAGTENSSSHQFARQTITMFLKCHPSRSS